MNQYKNNNLLLMIIRNKFNDFKIYLHENRFDKLSYGNELNNLAREISLYYIMNVGVFSSLKHDDNGIRHIEGEDKDHM